MRCSGCHVECLLRGHGEYGWEVVLFSDGRDIFGRRFVLRAEALAEAESLRRLVEREW